MDFCIFKAFILVVVSLLPFFFFLIFWEMQRLESDVVKGSDKTSGEKFLRDSRMIL